MQLIKFEGLTEAENKRIAKLAKYRVGFSKLWSSDTNRSLTGAYKGTLIGIFPKLTISIGSQNDNDRSMLLKIVNSQFKDVTYYDAEYKSMVKKTFYFGDVEDEIKKAVGDRNSIKHSAIEFSIVATTRRTTDDKV